MNLRDHYWFWVGFFSLIFAIIYLVLFASTAFSEEHYIKYPRTGEKPSLPDWLAFKNSNNCKVEEPTPWKKLVDILDDEWVRFELSSEEARGFIRKHKLNPCFSRSIYERFIIENNFSLNRKTGIIIQIFENAKAAEKFSDLRQPVRDPRWAEGVVGIIETKMMFGSLLSFINEIQVLSEENKVKKPIQLFTFDKHAKRLFSRDKSYLLGY